jgi:hypothetical protein
MKAMTDVLTLLVAGIAGVVAVLYYYWFATARTRVGDRIVYDMQGTQSSSYLYIAIAATVVACVAIVFYFLRHVNKEEEIHITQ